MPVPTAGLLRQRLLRPPVYGAGGVAVLVLATAVACTPSGPVSEDPQHSSESDENTRPAGPESLPGPAAEPATAAELPASVGTERSRSGANDSTDPVLAAVPDDAWFAGHLIGLDGAGDARHLRALLPIDARRLLLIGVERGRRESEIRTWILPAGRPETPVRPVDRVRLQHDDSPGAGPRLVPIEGVGAMVFEERAHRAGPDGGSALMVRAIGLDADVHDSSHDAEPLPVPGWRFRGTWAVGALGDGAVVCLGGEPEVRTAAGEAGDTTDDAAPAPSRIACGLLSFESEWVTPPQPLVEPADANGRAVAAWLGGAGDGRTMLTWYDSSPTARAVFGAILTRDGGAIATTHPVNLTPAPLDAGDEYAYRRTPQALSVGDAIAFALPGHRQVPARAGALAADGSIAVPVRQIESLGALLEAPRMLAVGGAARLLFDATDDAGVRSAVFYSDHSALVMNHAPLLPATAVPAAAAVRLGPTWRGHASVVWTAPGPAAGFALLPLERPPEGSASGPARR